MQEDSDKLELPASPEFRFARSQCLSFAKLLPDKPSPVGIILYWISSKNQSEIGYHHTPSAWGVELGPKACKQPAVGQQRKRDEVSVPQVNANIPYGNTEAAFWLNQ